MCSALQDQPSHFPATHFLLNTRIVTKHITPKVWWFGAAQPLRLAPPPPAPVPACRERVDAQTHVSSPPQYRRQGWGAACMAEMLREQLELAFTSQKGSTAS
jgi:hypothetical protein